MGAAAPVLVGLPTCHASCSDLACCCCCVWCSWQAETLVATAEASSSSACSAPCACPQQPPHNVCRISHGRRRGGPAGGGEHRQGAGAGLCFCTNRMTAPADSVSAAGGLPESCLCLCLVKHCLRAPTRPRPCPPAEAQVCGDCEPAARRWQRAARAGVKLLPSEERLRGCAWCPTTTPACVAAVDTATRAAQLLACQPGAGLPRHPVLPPKSSLSRCWRWTATAPWCRCLRAPAASTTGPPRSSSRARQVAAAAGRLA